MRLKRVSWPGYEQIVEWTSDRLDCTGMIAIHSTRLGPALGGCRLWQYRDLDEAREDVLRLSRGMTYKNAMAGLPYGGGKAVILGPLKAECRPQVFREFGRAVEQLGGSYVTAEDVGTSPDDLAEVARETTYAAGLADGSGDPSPWTALGVYHAIRAGVLHRFGTDSLRDIRIAIQGCGHVGADLARRLHAEGASMTLADVSPERAQSVAEETGATMVSADDIMKGEMDVFAPCALGGVLNHRSIPGLRASIIAGAANNQLAENSCGLALHARGTLYLPDYVVNAGGVISIAASALGCTPEETLRRVAGIGITVRNLLQACVASELPPFLAADEIVERRLRDAPMVGSASPSAG